MKDFFRLLRLMRPQAGWMALAVLLSTLATLAHAGLMATSGWFITATAMAGLAGLPLNIFNASASIRAFALGRTVARYLERLVGHEATLKFVARLRPWFFTRLVPLAPAALESERSGDLLARLKGDIDRLEFAFLRILSPAIAGALAAAASVTLVAFYDAPLAAILGGLFLLAGLGLPLLVHRLGAGAARRVTHGAAELDALLVEHMEGVAELAIYDPAGRHRAALTRVSDGLIADEGRLATLAGLSAAGVGAAAQAALLAALLLGAPRVMAGTLPAADWPMLALFVLAAFEAVAPLPLAFQTLPSTLAAARRLFNLVERPPPVAEPATPRAVPAGGDLAFRDAGLTYDGARAPALADITLTLVPGRRIAVIGPSGAGKSSLAALALRFRTPTAGDVAFAGTSLAAYEGDDLRHRIAVLAQNDHLFSATIRENLLLARPDATSAQLETALARAGMADFVAAQPEGLDTFVGALGAKVSGGEARRLGLARALLKDAPILILDEPTEGLDAGTERQVLDAVLAASRERALLLITHRRARLEAMDEIILLEAGRIAARGTPQQMRRHLPGANGERRDTSG